MKTGVKLPLNLIIITVAITALALSMASFTGCRDNTTAEENQAGGQETVTETAAGDQQESPEEQGGRTGAESSDQTEGSGSEDQMAEEETMEVPAEITEVIGLAEDYFTQGLYAEAVHEYRNAARMIEDSILPDGMKEELLGSIENNHREAVSITDTARMHHSNAMNLIYEKRFEEAKAELEAALAIYPKYQAAIDALASLEALMGLE